MKAWNPHLTEDDTPGWSAPPEPELVGLDFLGTLPVNLEMVGELTEGFNNVASSARQHTILAWAAWRFRENLVAAGQDAADPAEWRAFLEAVETVQLVGQTELSAELGRERAGLGSEGIRRIPPGAQLTLRFSDYGRTPATSAMAAVNYGPSAGDIGLGLLRGWGGAYVATPERGVPLALALDPLLRRSEGYAWLARYPTPTAMPRSLAVDLAHKGLAVGPLQRERTERTLYTSALFDLDGADVSGRAYRRRSSLALLLTAVDALAGSGSEMEVRRLLLARTLPGGAFPVPAHLEAVAARWQIFLVRQLQRVLLETWLYVAERWMGDTRTPALLAGRVGESLAGKLDLRPVWGMSLGEARAWFATRHVGTDAGAWAASMREASPWVLLWDEVRAPIRAARGRPEAGIPGLVGLTLAVLALTRSFVPKTGKLGAWAEKGGRERISLALFGRWCEHRAARPFPNFVEDLLGELVLQQHVAIAAARFDNEKRRLRFCNDELGWDLLAGVEPSLPVLAPDRLAALLALLVDLGLVTAGHTLTGEARAILAGVAERG